MAVHNGVTLTVDELTSLVRMAKEDALWEVFGDPGEPDGGTFGDLRNTQTFEEILRTGHFRLTPRYDAISKPLQGVIDNYFDQTRKLFTEADRLLSYAYFKLVSGPKADEEKK